MQVEQDRVGMVLGHKRDCLLPVRGGADHLDAGQPAEQQHQALTHAGLVVGDDDAQRSAVGCTGGGHGVPFPGWTQGSSAVTIHWLSRRPACSVPFSSRSLSRIPVSP